MIPPAEDFPECPAFEYAVKSLLEASELNAVSAKAVAKTLIVGGTGCSLFREDARDVTVRESVSSSEGETACIFTVHILALLEVQRPTCLSRDRRWSQYVFVCSAKSGEVVLSRVGSYIVPAKQAHPRYSAGQRVSGH